MPGNLARPVRRGAVRKRTRELREPRRTAYPTEGSRPSRCLAALVWLFSVKGMPVWAQSLRDVTGSRSSATVTRREKKCLAHIPWPAGTVHSHSTRTRNSARSGSAASFLMLSFWSGMSRRDRDWPPSMTVKSPIGTGPSRTRPMPTYPSWGWTNTRAPGWRRCEWRAPPTAAARAHIAVTPRVFPGTGLVISEQYVVVGAVPFTWGSFRLLTAGLRFGDRLDPSADSGLGTPSPRRGNTGRTRR